MLATDQDALLCDLAETYHIYDMESLPLETVATLAVGLRPGSRIKMKMSGAKAPDELLLLAHIVDRLGLLVWQNTKDGQRGINRPASIVDLINGSDNKDQIITDSYATPEDFWEARNLIIQKGGR